MSDWLRPWLLSALVEQVPRDHTEPDSALRRRRVVVAVTLVVGAVLLALSLTSRPGSIAFYPLTAGLAATWVVGALLSGPLHLGWIEFRGTRRRPVITSLLIGLATAAVFVVGSLVVREIGPLREFVQHVLDHARRGSIVLVAVITIANGIAEEIFFRGALYAAIGHHRPVLISTVVYALVTLASGNPMLGFAAVAVGAIFALQRRASGGVLASSITHVTWSTIMLFALPALFR
ncbi:MAG: hypothetical protein JWN95_103 [Frankiales bacterium]|nr:hypothetical protein [Frankiales bacterium]